MISCKRTLHANTSMGTIIWPCLNQNKTKVTKVKQLFKFFTGKILEWAQLWRTNWCGFHSKIIKFWWWLQQVYWFIIRRNIWSGSKYRKTSKNQTQSSPINRKYILFSLEIFINCPKNLSKTLFIKICQKIFQKYVKNLSKKYVKKSVQKICHLYLLFRDRQKCIPST